MRALKSTYDALKAQGIEIKIYPNATYEEWYKECWQREYDWCASYHKNWNSPNCYGYIHSQEQYEAECTKWADQHAAKRANNWYDSEYLYIAYEGRLIRRKIATKSKQITTEYVLNQVEKDRKAYQGKYGKFAVKMQALLHANKIGRSMYIYPTTYGIGVWAIYNFALKECISLVDDILNEKGIQFRNEYSDAEWVYRYVISKEKSNLDKINN